MRKYTDKNEKELLSVVCNRCKKELKVENGIIKEGCFCGDTRFGYFSNKDGFRYLFDLCEECYDAVTAEFAVPVQTEEMKELL